jgi:hypothetical protein
MTQQILKQMKLYKPTVKFSEDQNTGARKPYPPTVKVSLRQRKEGKFETAFYDSDRKEIKDVPIEDLIVKRMSVMALIECTSVWISSVGCGLSWRLTQMKVVSRPDKMSGYAFIDDEDASRAAGGSSSLPPAKNAFTSAFDDEDEEVNDEEVLNTKTAAVTPAPAPAAVADEVEAEDHAPAAVPKKAIVKKKVVSKPA